MSVSDSIKEIIELINQIIKTPNIEIVYKINNLMNSVKKNNISYKLLSLFCEINYQLMNLENYLYYSKNNTDELIFIHHNFECIIFNLENYLNAL